MCFVFLMSLIARLKIYQRFAGKHFNIKELDAWG